MSNPSAAIIWRDVMSRPGFLPTEKVLKAQCQEDALSVEHVLEKYVNNPSSNHRFDGEPREFHVAPPPCYYRALMRNPEMLACIAALPKRSTHFRYTEAQLRAIALLAIGRDLQPDPREMTVTLDTKAASCSGVGAKPGDEQWAKVTAGIGVGGPATWLVDMPTGCGKTIVALAAVVWKLCDPTSWQRCVARHAQTRRAMCSSGRLGFTNGTCENAHLLRAALIRTMSPVMNEHFLAQFLMAWPGLKEQLPRGLTIEIWAAPPPAALVDLICSCNAKSGARLVLKTSTKERSLPALLALRADTVVMWFLGMKAEDNARLRVPAGRKRTLNEMVNDVAPAACTFAASIYDEMMRSSTAIIPNQDPLCAHPIVLQATPDQLAKAEMHRTHFMREIVHPKIHLLLGRGSLTRGDMLEAVGSLARIELCSLPLQLRREVAHDMLPTMPDGLDVLPVSVVSGRLAASSDPMARCTVGQWVAMLVPGHRKYDVPRLLEGVFGAPNRTVDAHRLGDQLGPLLAAGGRPCRADDDTVVEAIERRLAAPGLCVMCGDGAAVEAVMMCCTGLVCRACAAQPTCPHCSPGAAPIVPCATLDELAARPLRPVVPTAVDALELLTRGPAGRVLIMCTQVEDALKCLQTAMPTARMAPVSDKVAVRDYRAKGRESIILVCPNNVTSVVGLDLGCTTALVVVGELANPAQLVGRVLRPGADQAGRRIPLVVISSK